MSRLHRNRSLLPAASTSDEPAAPYRAQDEELARHARRAWLSLVACALAAGCSTGPSTPLGEAEASSSTWLVITDAGAGAVGPDTRYEEGALSRVAARADIRPIQTANEDATVWTHAAFIEDVQAVQFFEGSGGRVGELHGVTQHLAGPNGERIGMTMAHARVRGRDCRVGKALWRGMAICKARGARSVELVFSVPQYDGPFDRLPGEDDLKRAELQRIVWRANG